MIERTPVEIERHRRIRLALWAYSYEVLDTPLVSDDKFDEECRLVDVSMSTGNPLMDNFFKSHFQPHTGQWIHFHPELAKVEKLCRMLLEGNGKS